MSRCDDGSFVIDLGKLLACKVSLPSIHLLCLLFENDVFSQLWYNIIVVVLVLKFDLEEALILVVHSSVHLRQVDGRVWVVLLRLLALWHVEWRHALSKDSTDLVFLLVLRRDCDVVVLLDFGGDLLLVGLHSVVEVVGVVLVASLKVQVLVELLVVDSLEGRLVLCLSAFGFGLAHLMLKFVGCLLDLIVPGLVVLFVWPGDVQLHVIVFFDLVQVDFLSLLLGGIQAQLLVLAIDIILTIDHFLGLLDEVGHELRVSVIGRIETDHLNVLNTMIKLTQIDGLLVDVVLIKHLLFLLLLQLLSLLLSESDFFLGGLSFGVFVGLLLGKLGILLDLDLVFDLHGFLIDFLIPLLGVPVVVLHIGAIGLDIIGVVFVGDSLIPNLDKPLILSGLTTSMHITLPLNLSLVF